MTTHELNTVQFKILSSRSVQHASKDRHLRLKISWQTAVMMKLLAQRKLAKSLENCGKSKNNG